MVKPIQTFALLGMTAALLYGISFFKEIPLAKDMAIKMPQAPDLLTMLKDREEYADIADIKDKFGEVNEDSENSPKKPRNKKVDDQGNYKPFVPDSLKLDKESRIQYPKKKDTLLYAFFRSLDGLLASSNDFIRVLHFGDSQLEGDRITGFLREKFQATFGGSGVGLVPVVNKLNALAFWQKSDPAWQYYSSLGIEGYSRSRPSYYGILGRYYFFPVQATTGYHSEKESPFQYASYRRPLPFWTKASVTYSVKQGTTHRQKKVQNVKLLYRNPEAPFEVEVSVNGSPVSKEEIAVSKDFQYWEQEIKSNGLQSISVSVAAGQASPQIYGVALDSKKGIAFDNIPWRGSSGIEFTRMEQKLLKQQIQDLKVKLIILQFGVNVVPNPLPDYTFYENQYYQQLKLLKSLAPNVSILVIGVSDMSRKVGGGYESYPNIEKIRNAQKKAAFRAGCAFWDLYEAMGGKNSMPSWVFEKPPLANRDFTHFTPRGAEIVAEMLYKAILIEYDKYNQLSD